MFNQVVWMIEGHSIQLDKNLRLQIVHNAPVAMMEGFPVINHSVNQILVVSYSINERNWLKLYLKQVYALPSKNQALCQLNCI